MFGLLPAIRATYVSPVSTMRSGGRSVSAGRERNIMRRVLVSTQVALSLVLLVGALLLECRPARLLTTDAGFQPEGVVTVNVDFAKSSAPRETRWIVYRELLNRLSSLPGVISAAQVGSTPIGGGSWDMLIGPDGTLAAGSGKTAFQQSGSGLFSNNGHPLDGRARV